MRKISFISQVACVCFETLTYMPMYFIMIFIRLLKCGVLIGYLYLFTCLFIYLFIHFLCIHAIILVRKTYLLCNINWSDRAKLCCSYTNSRRVIDEPSVSNIWISYHLFIDIEQSVCLHIMKNLHRVQLVLVNFELYLCLCSIPLFLLSSTSRYTNIIN